MCYCTLRPNSQEIEGEVGRFSMYYDLHLTLLLLLKDES